MKKRLNSVARYIIWILIGLFLFFLLWFLSDHVLYKEHLPRNVFLVNTDVSLMNQREFFELIDNLQKNINEQEIYLRHKNLSILVSPNDVGLRFDREILWNQVYTYGHRGSLFEQFFVWLESFYTQKYFEPQLFTNKEQLNKALSLWSQMIETRDPYNGNLSIVGLNTEVKLPQAGTALDKELLSDYVIESLLKKEKGFIVQVPLKTIEPERSIQDLIDAQYMVDMMIGSSITLYNPNYPKYSLVLEIKDLADLVSVSVPDDTTSDIFMSIDDEILVQKLAPLYPRKARFVLSEDKNINLKPSQDGFDINLSKTADSILKAGRRTEDRHARFFVDNFIQPSFNTKVAESLRIEHLVSQFTTYHSCCADRVENIHLVADILDGKILEPGEILAMNDFLGERTKERGFKSAGTIIKGKLEDSVGGGISQFITTLHNAVYWGGYDILEHKTHSIYFSRYPEGIEATINWPWVDYVFKNDTQTGMYIDTSYTDTSITVSIYGSNGGRVAIGDQREGQTFMEITGGSDLSRTLISEVSPRYNIKAPLIEYEADPTIIRGEQLITQQGDPRWSVDVSRIIKQGEVLIKNDNWTVHYRGDNTIVKKNPCDIYLADFDYSVCS